MPLSPVQRACPNCATPVDVDQRYCIACGERQAELPARVREMLGLEVASAPVVPPFAQPEVAVAAADEVGRIGWFTLPRPRDMAIAVLAVLGFGVIVGTAVSPAASTSAAPTILVYAQPPAAAPADTSTADTPVPDTTVAPTVAVAPTVVAAAPAPAPAAPAQKPAKQPSAPAPAATSTTPPIKHVFLIVLSDQGFNQAFGASSTAPYLSKTLTAQGELLTNYYAVASGNLANSVALISGQGPTISTTQNCTAYTDVAPGTVDQDGQVIGDGCIYPKTTQTVGDELIAGGHSWKAYVQGMGTAADGKPATCRTPATPGTTTTPTDPAATAAAPLDAYSAAHNPWVFFHSVTDTPLCASNDVGIEQLDTDLKTETTTPSLSYIVPDLCHNGSDTPCAPGQPAGLPQADAFLQEVVPKIMDSDAYENGGMIAITFDQAPQTGENADSSACCETPAYPNLAGYTPPAAAPATDPAATTPTDPTATTPVDPTATTPVDPTATTPIDPTVTTPPDPTAPTPVDPTGAPSALRAPTATAAQFGPGAGSTPSTPTTTSTTPTTTTTGTTTTTPTTTTPVDSGLPTTATGGGGHVGLLLLSPYVKPATTSAFSYYNHFSLLRSIEQLFGVQELGYSSTPTLSTFDATVYTNPTGEAASDAKTP